MPYSDPYFLTETLRYGNTALQMKLAEVARRRGYVGQSSRDSHPFYSMTYDDVAGKVSLSDMKKEARVHNAKHIGSTDKMFEDNLAPDTYVGNQDYSQLLRGMSAEAHRMGETRVSDLSLSTHSGLRIRRSFQ